MCSSDLVNLMVALVGNAPPFEAVCVDQTIQSVTVGLATVVKYSVTVVTRTVLGSAQLTENVGGDALGKESLKVGALRLGK